MGLLKFETYLKKNKKKPIRVISLWFLLTSTLIHLKSATSVISRYTDIDCTLMHIVVSNSFNFFESLKVVLINMLAILIMSAKLAALGLLKRKVFWNKVYNVIIFVHDVSNKTLSRHLIYIVNMVLWPPKFGNSSISIGEFIITKQQFYKDLTSKNNFLRGALGSSAIIWDWH